MRRRAFLAHFARATALSGPIASAQVSREWVVRTEQITHGPSHHHFFGYIGHVGNIPWNGSERYLVALRTGWQDRMPRPGEPADIVLLDTRNGYRATVVEQTRAWNFQQGTMLYWNPRQPETQFLFNDRDPSTHRVFTVLFDVAKRKRVREFRFADTPFGNGGSAQRGGAFLGINYGRMARLRPVTGYPGAFDWNPNTPAPDDDGVFRVEVETGSKRLLVSFGQLARQLQSRFPAIAGKHLFINHTLWSRDDSRIFFFVRGDFETREIRVDIPCVMRADGSGLEPLGRHIGGHPEWESGTRMIGSAGGRLVLWDIERQQVADELGSREIFPDTGGDTAISPDGQWIVNGYRTGVENRYVVFRRRDATWSRTAGFPHPGWTSGELRVDAAPCWNRRGNAFAFPAIAPDGSRQMFVGRIVERQ